MKKCLLFVLTAAVLFSFAACKKSPENISEESTAPEQSTSEAAEETTARELETLRLRELEPDEVLVVYFNGREGVEEAAKAVSAALSCDSFEIVPAEPYPEEEEAKLERAANEYENLLLPALEGHVEDMSAYSAIVAVFPEFGGNLPMAVRTFMEDYDLRRTLIVPVCLTSDKGVGFAMEQFRSLMSLCPVYGGTVITPEEDIRAKTAELLDAALQ